MQTPLALTADEVHLTVEPASGAVPALAQVRLDDQLCFALYTAATEVVRTYRPLLAELGLTYPQYLIMMALWGEDDQTVSDLARALHLPVHGLLPVLNRLAEAGLVARDRDPVDRRATRLTLTPAGRVLELEAATVQRTVACRARLTPDAIADLRSRLQDLSQDLRTPLPTPGAA